VSGILDPFGGAKAQQLTAITNTPWPWGGVLQLGTVPNSMLCPSIWMRVASGTLDVHMGVDDTCAAVFTLTTTWTRFNYPVDKNGIYNQGRLFEMFAVPGSVWEVYGSQVEIGSTPTQEIITTNLSAIGLGINAPWSTNLTAWSEAFTQYGNQDGVTVTDNVIAGPSGKMNGALFIENIGTGAGHKLYRGISVTPNTSYALQFKAKAGTRTVCQCWSWASDNTGTSSTFFNLISGVITGVLVGNATMTLLPNGWWLCTRTIITNSTATGSAYGIGPSDGSGLQVYNGDGVSGCYFTEEQYEVGSIATPYIATTNAIVTLPDASSTYLIESRDTHDIVDPNIIADTYTLSYDNLSLSDSPSIQDFDINNTIPLTKDAFTTVLSDATDITAVSDSGSVILNLYADQSYADPTWVSQVNATF
jgi:hypothetical protein